MTTRELQKRRKNGKPEDAAKEMLSLPWHFEAELAITLAKPPLTMLVGDPGVGKTTFARQLAIKRTGLPPLVISGSPEVDQSHLFGRWTLVGNETKFVDGPLPLALKEAGRRTSGRWLLIEEFSQIPLECRAALLPLRDQTELSNGLNNETLNVPPSFRLITTSNNESLTCRKNQGIAKVLYDGFLIIECGELTNSNVMSMLKLHFPQASDDQLSRAFERWNEYRDLTSKGASGKSHLSFRACQHLVQLLEAGLPENRAVQIALVNKFMPSDPDLFQAASLKNSLQE